MTSSNPIHPILRPIATTPSENLAKPIAEKDGPVVASSVQKVNDLLKAFSDTAYSSEEDQHSWESWNYTRLSAF